MKKLAKSVNKSPKYCFFWGFTCCGPTSQVLFYILCVLEIVADLNVSSVVFDDVLFCKLSPACK